MAFNVGSFTMYDDSNSIADPTVLVAAKAIQLAPNKGAFYQSMSAPDAILKTVDFEIYNRSKQTRTGTLAAAITTTNETTITLDSTGVYGVTVGDIIVIDSEYMWISSITDRSAGTVVVTRAVGSTSAATHLNAATFTVVGNAINTANLKNVEAMAEATGKYTNYAQLITKVIEWDKEAEVLKRKGLSDEQIYLTLIKEATTRYVEDLSYTALHGKKQIGTDGGVAYMTDGVFNQLADTASGGRPVIDYNVNGTLTEAKLRAALQEVFDAPGSVPNTIWTSTTNYETMRNWLVSMTINNQMSQGVIGMAPTAYNFNNTLLSVKIDSDMPDDKIIVADMNKMFYKWVDGDGMRFVEEPKQSSREMRYSIQGRVGFAVEDVGYSHTYLYGIS